MMKIPDKLRNIKISPENLTIAFTHPSYKVVDPLSKDYQRLELVGDAVLDLLVIEKLFVHLDSSEGVLSSIRSRIVNNSNLARAGTFIINISPYLRVAPAYIVQERDIASTIEAIFGACFIDSGIEECQKLLQLLFKTELDEAILSFGKSNLIGDKASEIKSAVSIMLEYFQRMHLELPAIKTRIIGGADHEPIFKTVYTATVNGQRVTGSGKGRNKKKAAEKAAVDLCKKLKIELF
ncbi:MAG: ribonuclease III domain-containing protein [Candidatus Hodarchaeales archaeon]